MKIPGSTSLAASLLCAASMWFYVQHVLIPYQVNDAAQHERPRGNFSDLYPRWLGARELLLHHRDPYSPEITAEIQAGYYGRPLDASRPSDPKDQQAFAYPLYVVFLLAPTVFLPFHLVQPLFQCLLVVLTGLSAWLWLKAIRWEPLRTVFPAILVFSLCNFPAVQGVKLQQLSLFVCALIAISVACVTRNRLWSAGFVLALATIKPQLTVLPAAWLLLWAGSDFRRRRGLIYGFFLTLISLTIASELLLPGWITRFAQALSAYTQYADGWGSTLDALMTPLGGRSVAVLLVAGAAVLAWRARHDPAESPVFVFYTVLLLALVVVVLPMTSPYNQLLLLPGTLLLARDWRYLWHGRLARLLTSILVLAIGWPWLAAAGLAAASVVRSAKSIQQAWALPLYTSLAIPSAVLVLLMAYARANLKTVGSFAGGSATNKATTTSALPTNTRTSSSQ